MKLMDVVVLGVLLAGGYYLLTNPEAMKQLTDMFGNLGAGLAPPGGAFGGDDACAAECAAQTQAALAIGMDPEYFNFAYASKKQSKSQKNGKEEKSENGNGGGNGEAEGEGEAKGGAEAEGEAGAEPGAVEPEAEAPPCDCSQYTETPAGGEEMPAEGEGGEEAPAEGEGGEEAEGGEEDEGGEESGFARAYRTRVRRRPQRRFRAYSGYGYAHKYAGWGNGHRIQPGYSGYIPRVH